MFSRSWVLERFPQNSLKTVSSGNDALRWDLNEPEKQTLQLETFGPRCEEIIFNKYTGPAKVLRGMNYGRLWTAAHGWIRGIGLDKQRVEKKTNQIKTFLRLASKAFQMSRSRYGLTDIVRFFFSQTLPRLIWKAWFTRSGWKISECPCEETGGNMLIYTWTPRLITAINK